MQKKGVSNLLVLIVVVLICLSLAVIITLDRLNARYLSTNAPTTKPTTQPSGCKTDPDCDDKNPCTKDTCEKKAGELIGKCKNDAKAMNGSNCDVVQPSGSKNPGFCKDGKCVLKDCTNVYGTNFETCGSGSGLACCRKGGCCVAGTFSKSYACCKPNEVCSSFLGNAFCSPKTCPDPNFPKFCPGTKQNICCIASATCIESSGFADCGQTACNTGQTACPASGGFFNKGILCCNSTTEHCENVERWWWCTPNSCQLGEFYCQGIGKDYTWRKRCCKMGQICTWMPNGYPICWP
jgi:hypothetical protein